MASARISSSDKLLAECVAASIRGLRNKVVVVVVVDSGGGSLAGTTGSSEALGVCSGGGRTKSVMMRCPFFPRRICLQNGTNAFDGDISLRRCTDESDPPLNAASSLVRRQEGRWMPCSVAGACCTIHSKPAGRTKDPTKTCTHFLEVALSDWSRPPMAFPCRTSGKLA